MRMAQKRKERKLQGKDGGGGGALSGHARAGSLNVKMTAMTVSKVVVGVLIMLLCMPFLEVSFVSMTRQDGLELIVAQVASGADAASVQASVDLYREHHKSELYRLHLGKAENNESGGSERVKSNATFVGPLDWYGTPSPQLRDRHVPRVRI